MQGHERRTSIALWECLSIVKRDPQRRGMRWKLVSRSNRGGLFVGGYATKVRIRATRTVHVGPAVEAAFGHFIEFARRVVIAQQVASVVGGEKRTGARLPGEIDRIAQSRGISGSGGTIEFIAQHGGAGFQLFARVAARSKRHIESVVRTDVHGLTPMVATLGQARHDFLGHTRGCALRCSKADTRNTSTFADVEPAVVQRQAVRPVKTLKQHIRTRGSPIGSAGKQEDLAFTRRAHQQIAHVGHRHQTSVGNSCCPDLDVETVRQLHAIFKSRLAKRSHLIAA